MGYYIDSVIKFNIDTYEELLEYGAMKAKEERNSIIGRVIEPYDLNATTETIDELINEDGEVYLDDDGSICIKLFFKYGSFIQSVIEGFVSKLIEEEREDEFTYLSLGEEFEDTEQSGYYDDDMFIVREMETNLSKPMKLKKGTFFVKIDLGGK